MRNANMKSSNKSHPKAIATRPNKQSNSTVAHPKPKVQMLPETICAMNAITNPFKARENCARFPDGKGGDSSASTDRLILSEGNEAWLDCIQKANIQWNRYNPLLSEVVEGDYSKQDKSYVDPSMANQFWEPNALQNVFGDTGQDKLIGWNLLYCDAPIPCTGCRNPLPLNMNSATCLKVYANWRDITIKHVYYFALPSTMIDATKGNFGGPSNSFTLNEPEVDPSLYPQVYDYEPPSRSHKSQRSLRDDKLDGYYQPPNVSASQVSDALRAQSTNTLDAENWKETHELELENVYPVNLSAPMQIYRVLHISFSLDQEKSSNNFKKLSEKLELIERFKKVLPELDLQTLLSKFDLEENGEMRYTALVINPIAGVTQWPQFEEVNSVPSRNDDFAMLPFWDSPTPADMPDVPQKPPVWGDWVSQRATTLRKINTRQVLITDHGDNALPFIRGTNPQGYDHLYTPSDFTFAAGHNGVPVSNVASKEMVTRTLKYLNPFAENEHGKPLKDNFWITSQSTESVVGNQTIHFENGLVSARRIVGFGMKLFSTQPAVVASGRVAGGQLPISLVSDHLRFHMPGQSVVSKWVDAIEARMEEYTAFRALEGATVRYDPLQTERQQGYVYTPAGVIMNVKPVGLSCVHQKVDKGLSTEIVEGDIPARSPLNEDINTDNVDYYIRGGLTGFSAIAGPSSITAELPQTFMPPSEGTEEVPCIIYAPGDAELLNYASENTNEGGLMFQAVLHTENQSTNNFPLQDTPSVMDPNWQIFSQIVSNDRMFPMTVSGHSFKSFFNKVGKILKKSLEYGAVAIEIGEKIAPLL